MLKLAENNDEVEQLLSYPRKFLGIISLRQSLRKCNSQRELSTNSSQRCIKLQVSKRDAQRISRYLRVIVELHPSNVLPTSGSAFKATASKAISESA